jgi:hypothetical protein
MNKPTFNIKKQFNYLLDYSLIISKYSAKTTSIKHYKAIENYNISLIL